MYKFFTTLLFLIITLNPQGVFAGNKLFYLKASLISAKMSKIKENSLEQNLDITQESAPSFSFGTGIGYYWTPNLRSELYSERVILDFAKSKGNFSYTENNIYTAGVKSGASTVVGATWMINNYVNIINKDLFSVLVGSGIGLSRIKERVTYFYSGYFIENGELIAFPSIVDKINSKTKLNWSYSLMTGVNLKTNAMVTLELLYQWRHYGRIKHYFDSDSRRSNNFKGHIFSVGILLDL